MPKISELDEKLATEVEDSNLFAIEDEEDTKKITVKEVKKLLKPIQERFVKEIINETLDRISEAILSCKYEFSDVTIKRYRLNTWIGSNSGNIQIALLDKDENRWLTQEELEELFSGEQEFTIKVRINHTWEEPVSMRILSFIEEHESAEDINPWMYADDAGFLKIHLDDLTNNEISRIIYEDIRIRMESKYEFDEETEADIEVERYKFFVSRDSFANAVPYMSTTHCPCCYMKHPGATDTEDTTVPDESVTEPDVPDVTEPEVPDENPGEDEENPDVDVDVDDLDEDTENETENEGDD